MGIEIEIDDYEYSYHHSLSFFRALNPTSKHSGITYYYSSHEVEDITINSSINKALNANLTLLSGLSATFTILVGKHFDLFAEKICAPKGYKGILDFFILPLLARKLIADTYLDKRQKLTLTNTLLNTLAWTIAVPIEIARFSAGIALTLLLAPVVAFVHLLKMLTNCLSPATQYQAIIC